MSSNEQRLLTNEEIASVTGADGTAGVVAGPNGEGCTPDIDDLLFPNRPKLPTLQEILGNAESAG